MKCVLVFIHALALQATAIDGNKVSTLHSKTVDQKCVSECEQHMCAIVAGKVNTACASACGHKCCGRNKCASEKSVRNEIQNDQLVEQQGGKTVAQNELHLAADDTDSSSMGSAVVADADSAEFEKNQAEDEAERIAKQVEKEMTAEDAGEEVAKKAEAVAKTAEDAGEEVAKKVEAVAKKASAASPLDSLKASSNSNDKTAKLIAAPDKKQEEAEKDDTEATKEDGEAEDDSKDDEVDDSKDDSKNSTQTDEKEDESKKDKKEDEAKPKLRQAVQQIPAQRRIPNMRHQKEAGEGYQQGSPLYRRQQRLANQKAAADKDENSAAMQHIPLIGLLAAASTLAAHFY